MPRVLHLLSRFDIGGTERQLVERLRRHPRGFEPLLACSSAGGPFLEPIRSFGILLPLPSFAPLIVLQILFDGGLIDFGVEQAYLVSWPMKLYACLMVA